MNNYWLSGRHSIRHHWSAGCLTLLMIDAGTMVEAHTQLRWHGDLQASNPPLVQGYQFQQESLDVAQGFYLPSDQGKEFVDRFPPGTYRPNPMDNQTPTLIDGFQFRNAPEIIQRKEKSDRQQRQDEILIHHIPTQGQSVERSSDPVQQPRMEWNYQKPIGSSKFRENERNPSRKPTSGEAHPEQWNSDFSGSYRAPVLGDDYYRNSRMGDDPYRIRDGFR